MRRLGRLAAFLYALVRVIHNLIAYLKEPKGTFA